MRSEREHRSAPGAGAGAAPGAGAGAGRLIVISGPSGSGKSTLTARMLRSSAPRLARSISATTRPPRAGEVDGRDYWFLAAEEFERARARGELLEWARVHGNLYGTPEAPVRQAIAEGRCVVLVIDVQGGLQVREKVPEALLVFIEPPSLDELERRLRARGTDPEADIERRLADARRELETARFYDVRVVNDSLDRAAAELASILSRNGCGARADHD